MKEIKLFDAELELMEYLWEHGTVQANQLSEYLLEYKGWKKSSTYIVLKRLEKKGAVQRTEPKYTVVPLVTREQVQLAETNSLVNKMFGGSFASLFANFVSSDQVSETTLEELQKMIDENRKQK